MFEFQDFIKIVLILLIAFIGLATIGLAILMLTDYTKKATKDRENEEYASNFKTCQPDSQRLQLPRILPRINKAEKIYITDFNPFIETNIKEIKPGIVVEPPNEAEFHFGQEEYILEMEDGNYIKVPRNEIRKRNWLTWKERFNELPDEPVKNTEDE